MKHAKNFLCFLVLNCFCAVIYAQSTITTTGGNATGSSGSVSYSVGQITFNTISGTNGIVTQGVQQPYEISVVTAIRNIEDFNLKCFVYPNPTNGLTKLVLESPDFDNLRFRLYDVNGNILQDKKVESRETEISLENLSSSVYFLKVIKNNQEVKVFKIVKN
jgi:hypothetical protein